VSTPECITLVREGGTAILTICNPARRNAFTKDMRRDLTAKINELQTDNAVRAIVLTGEGGHFCSGADVSRLGSTDWGVLELREWMRETLTVLRAFTAGVKPMIAAVEGDAVGAGLSLALACDFVVAARNARFTAAFARIGLMPDTGILYTLQRRIGLPKARKMMMLAQPVVGDEAGQIGLADEVVEPGQAVAIARQWAARFDDMAPLVVGAIRVGLHNGVDSIEEAMRIELDLQPSLVMSSDAKEGMRAFLEKRRPNFTGR
jgi:2-(1,2-epoxy-1,2-dihydrophenyl)acetyl-CoA isomerase